MRLTWHSRGSRTTRPLGQAHSIGRRDKSIAFPCHRAVLRRAREGVFVLCCFSMTATVWAQKPDADLTTKSLEDLMNIEVTSVSKKEEKLFQTAAAIYVITQEDIRRSGLSSIPELLRLAPGLDVARIDGNKWAISSRGFNDRFANKLLVLIDGRIIYTPQTAGVNWEAQDLLLEDIERIEVIRGPGGALWGANAVNGVINIITRRAQDTQGGLLAAGGGSEERGFGGARYGGKIGDNVFYRVYAKYFNTGGLVNAAGRNANDGRHIGQGGGRIDWKASDHDGLTLQGDTYGSGLRETNTAVSLLAPFALPVNTSAEFSGGNLLGRWNKIFSKRSDMALQVYFDRAGRQTSNVAAERIDTFDVDFQHHLAFGQRQDIVWGIGYRFISNRTDEDNTSPVQYNPNARSQLFNVFANDDFALVKDRFWLSLGLKLEHNDYSGFETQPSARLRWAASTHQMVWGAISRAVKTSAQVDRSLKVNFRAFPGPDGLPIVPTLLGNPNYESEELLAYELGYRVQPGRRLSLDIASFYNLYDRLQTIEPGAPFFDPAPRPHLVLPLRFENLLRGETYGLEASANLDISTRWKIQSSYSFLRMHMHRDALSRDDGADKIDGNSPQRQFQLHSDFRLPHNFDVNVSVYHISALVNAEIPSYTRLDLCTGWRIKENVEISAVLQNLLDDRHPEFTSRTMGVILSQVTRSAYGKVMFRF